MWVARFRQHQVNAVQDVIEAYQRGAKVVFLDAPTGSGKTLIAEAVRRVVGGSAIYSCTTKTLQDQVLEDYEYAAVLKGRANYPTELAEFPRVTAADCTGDPCNWCTERSRCEYVRARGKALNADFTVLNTAYLLTAWNGPRLFTATQRREVVVLDECDTLEGALMGFVELRMSEGRRKQYNLPQPARNPRSRVDADIEWVEAVLPKLVRRAMNLADQDLEDIKDIREAKWLDNIIARLRVLLMGLRDEDGVKWVLDYQGKDVVYRPVEVSQFGEQYLWRHGEKFLLMSASIISAQEMAASLGLEDEWEVVKVPSTFDKANRPTYPVYAGRVTAKTYNDVIGKVGDYAGRIIDHHPGERTLIHTVSYKMAQDIKTILTLGGHNRPIRTYTNSSEREGVLAWMKQTPGAVVLAPSFDRGVDLPGDLCRVQIVAKVPYPYLGDKQVSARLHSPGGQLWYSVQTVRTLVQMTGRGVRSKDDHAVTYILDQQFQDFWQRNKRLFPDWWSEAIDTSGRARARLEL